LDLHHIRKNRCVAHPEKMLAAAFFIVSNYPNKIVRPRR
jgi:hypothetical protein